MTHQSRLAPETSPYLVQHAVSPAEWCPRGDETFVKARAEVKPILLSIGYSSCTVWPAKPMAERLGVHWENLHVSRRRPGALVLRFLRRMEWIGMS